MSDESDVSFLALSMGLPDPMVLANRLYAMDPSSLARAATRLFEVARALDGMHDITEQSCAELRKGWSAQQPLQSLTRMATTAAQTASLLQNQGHAIELAVMVLADMQSNAKVDFAQGVADVHAAQQQSSWWSRVEGLLSIFRPADFPVMTALFKLTAALSQRAAGVEAALITLCASLVIDPTAEPDGLRAGPLALLPPDPVMNPASRTDSRNRAALAADMHSGDQARISFATSIAAALQQATRTSGTAQLVVYDSTAFQGQGRAAISVGDLTTAAHVAVLVPGISNSPSDMSGGLASATNLRNEASKRDTTGQTAVVAWYGYDIPLSWPKDPTTQPLVVVADTIAAASATNAQGGSALLAQDLRAIKAMSQSSTTMTLIGFSMGATVVSEAAKYDLPVDSIVLLGSPGAGWHTQSANGYKSVKSENVFVLSYDEDPITLPVTDLLAGMLPLNNNPYGPDPAAAKFQGNHIDANTNTAPAPTHLLTKLLTPLVGDPGQHSLDNYLQGRALVAEALIATGRGQLVVTKPGR